MIRKLIYSVVIIGFGLLLMGSDLKKEVLISGRTMGTTYHITLVTGYFSRTKNLRDKIEERLREINRSMSTYMADSEISRFNQPRSAGEPFHASEDFLKVMTAAQRVYRLTGGAWDGTVNPLINLWGFGPMKKAPKVPPVEEIKKMRRLVGFDKIEISEDGYLIKRNPRVTVDLAAIAKGYGVDAVSKLIRSSGIHNFLVEIGGEVYAGGLRKDGKPWRIGINTPRKDAPFDSVYTVVSLQDRALATSGGYRNFFVVNGRTFSHILDPRTGYPIQNRVASVSVAADNCTLADGLATGLVVLGREKGLALINRLDKVECLIVIREADGTLTDYPSSGFFTR